MWNLTFPKWQKTSTETYDTSSKAKQVQSLLNLINLIDTPALYYNLRIWCLVTWLITGYLSIESLIKSAEKSIVSPASLQQGTTWRSFINSNVLQDQNLDPAIKGYSSTQTSAWLDNILHKIIPRTSCTMSCSEDTCCPLSLWYLQCC